MVKSDKSNKKSNIVVRAANSVISTLHLWLGLACGLVLVTVASSGALLVFEDELTIAFYRNEQLVEPKGNAVPMDSLINIAYAVFPDKSIFRIERNSDPFRSVKIVYGTKKSAYYYSYLNPYNGDVLSIGRESDRFFSVILNLHRFLLAGDIGKVITGISCVITILMAFSGIYLWWPTNKKVLKQRTKVKWNGSKKRIIWDLHAVGGFYASFFLLIICFTGLVWSFEWVNDRIFIWADGNVRKQQVIRNRYDNLSDNAGVFERIWNKSNEIFPYQGSVLITIPAKSGVAITLSKENTEKSVKTSDMAYFDSGTGELLSVSPYDSLSSGTKIRKMIKPLHTGSVFGWPTKIISFLTAILTASLPITGFLIWRGKRKKKIHQSSIKTSQLIT